MTTIGELELKFISKKLIVHWKIEEFFSLPEGVYSSNLFSFANNSWCLIVYPKGNISYYRTANGFISVYLRKKPSNASIQIEYSFSLNALNGKTVLETPRTYAFESREYSEGIIKFLSRSELLKNKSEWMPSDVLTIICTLKCPESAEDKTNFSANIDRCGTSSETAHSSDEEDKEKEKVSSKIKGFKILSENLKQMLLDGRMCDAVLRVDCQEFKVHKSILVARSPVFASMFQHDLAEKNTNEVDIPDYTAESFQVFLHYLYSGCVEALSSSNVCNVYYAADKYQIDDLKEKCVKFMMEAISEKSFCDVITLSLRHGELKLQKIATDYFCQNVKKIMKTVEWIKYMEENATQANELLIKAFNA